MSCNPCVLASWLVAVDILELSESPCYGVDIYCSTMGLGAADGEGIRPETDTGTD